MTLRARRLGDYVMTEAKQARLDELAQVEKDRELATLNAQQAMTRRQSESKSEQLEPSEQLTAPLTSEPIAIPRTRRTRTRAA